MNLTSQMYMTQGSERDEAKDAEELRARLKQVVEKYAESHADAARKIGITPGGISRLMNSGTPNATTLAAIVRAFPLMNLEWLLTGEGVPERTPVVGTVERVSASELDNLQSVLDTAQKAVREIRQRYEPTLPPAGVDVDELWEVVRRLEGAARDELLRRAAELPPQAQAG